MLNKISAELILLLKAQGNTNSQIEDSDERAKAFICERYRLDKEDVDDSRLLLELKNAFLDVIDNLTEMPPSSFMRRYFEYLSSYGTQEYAFKTSLRLLCVKGEVDGGIKGFVNGFTEENTQLVIF